MKFVRVLKASEDWEVLRRHHDTENGEDYYYIWGPDGEYCDADGNPYHFDTREDALEEVEYLKAEHKFDKKSSAQRYTVEREDWGKSDIYEGERDRIFYIYDNIENEPISDGMGETIYYDNLEEAEFECEELNYSED